MFGVLNKKQFGSQLIYWVAALLYLSDRAFKQAALAFDTPISDALISFGLLLNRGAVFSLEIPGVVFWGAMLVAMAMLVWAWFYAFRKRRGLLPLLTFISLGAISNLLDRLFLDATVDYIGFIGIGAFNIADVMIIGSVAWLAWQETRRS